MATFTRNLKRKALTVAFATMLLLAVVSVSCFAMCSNPQPKILVGRSVNPWQDQKIVGIYERRLFVFGAWESGGEPLHQTHLRLLGVQVYYDQQIVTGLSSITLDASFLSLSFIFLSCACGAGYLLSGSPEQN